MGDHLDEPLADYEGESDQPLPFVTNMQTALYIDSVHVPVDWVAETSAEDPSATKDVIVWMASTKDNRYDGHVGCCWLCPNLSHHTIRHCIMFRFVCVTGGFS